MHLKDCLDMYLVQTHNCVWIVFVLSVLEKSESGREREKSRKISALARCLYYGKSTGLTCKQTSIIQLLKYYLQQFYDIKIDNLLWKL